tara:strand:+ start:195 stop:374 length:180 start_codon:yes stop_codon:yes gene_type:complete
MAYLTKILIKKHNGSPKGSSVRIHAHQLPYFIENGLIEGKIKKTKTKAKVEADIDTNEN